MGVGVTSFSCGLRTSKPVSAATYTGLVLVGLLNVALISLVVHRDAMPLSAKVRVLFQVGLTGILSGTAIGVAALVWNVALEARRLSKLILPVGTMVVGGVLVGALGHCALGWYALKYDAEIARQANAVLERTGSIELRFRDRGPLTLIPKKDGGYIRRDPLPVVLPRRIFLLIVLKEDRRLFDRLGQDIKARGRAVWRTVRNLVGGGPVEGGSGIAEQLAGLWFEDARTTGRGMSLTAMRRKVRKAFIGDRIFNLYSPQDQVWLYLSCAPFANLAGVEVSGLESASQALWGRPATRMSDAQLVLTLSLLGAPRRFEPWPRQTESLGAYGRRINSLRQHFEALLALATSEGIMTEQEARGARHEFMAGLRSRAQAEAELRPIFLKAAVDQVKALPQADGRLVRVDYVPEMGYQAALERAAAEAVEAVRRRTEMASFTGEQIRVDALVLKDDGTGKIAEVGATAIEGEGSSFVKPCLAAAALHYGLLRNIGDLIPGTGIRLSEMLTLSINAGAEAIAARLSPPRVAAYLTRCGLQIQADHIHVKNAIGSGGMMSVRQAGIGWPFHYGRPGMGLSHSLISRVVDGRTGQELYRPVPVRVVPEWCAIQVRSALERTATVGTAHVLKDVVTQQGGPIAAKTGTSAYRKFYKSRHGKDAFMGWRGNGGSWTIAASAPAHVVILVRMRFASGRPFPPNGGQSAALVIQKVLETLPDIKRKEPRHAL